MNEDVGKWRLWATGLVMVLCMLGLFARLYVLHAVATVPEGRDLTQGRSYERGLPGVRGSILESGPLRNTLALNIDLKDVCVDPQKLQEQDSVWETAGILSEYLDVEFEMLLERLSREDRRFEYVRRFVHRDKADRIARMELPGVFLRDSVSRNYPLGSFLCHVVGFTDFDGIGRAGIESSYNELLTGRPGLRHELLDGSRREIPGRRILEVAPLPGADVTLTIDQTIQALMEHALDEAMAEHDALAVWAIAQRVRTGEILAMASRPAYDLNNFRFSGDAQRVNRAISHVFEPGSVMKPMVIAAAINEGLITPSTVFDCENGLWHYARRPLRDYSAHGRLSVADILQKSSNIGTAKIALELGNARLEQYLRDFGFGSTLGIDLPLEERGILHAHKRWSALCATRIAIGQGVATTALQMLGAISAIANDGYLMRPYVVREVRRATDGEVLYRGEPQVIRRAIGSHASTVTMSMMRRVTEQGGTGRAARLENVAVAGKTGTGQKPVDGRYSDSDYMATFVGFFPADNPEVSMIIVVDEPRPLYTGGTVAAPVFRRVAEPMARYLDISDSPSRLAQHPRGSLP